MIFATLVSYTSRCSTTFRSYTYAGANSLSVNRYSLRTPRDARTQLRIPSRISGPAAVAAGAALQPRIQRQGGAGRHDNAFYLFESIDQAGRGAGDGRLSGRGPARAARESRRSIGCWPNWRCRRSANGWPCCANWRGTSATRPDAAAHPLGHLWGQLEPQAPRSARPSLALYRRIKNGPDGEPAGDQSCSLLELLDALVQYRNGVFGHGASRFDAFYEQEMGPLLLPAANEMLAEGVWTCWARAAAGWFI